MKNEPLFSIAIPTYNRLSFLRRALESALSQTYQNIEIIVLDNASTDGTYEYLLEMAKQYSHIKVITNAGNIGFVKNVQQIPDHTHGKYLNVLSDDDYLMPEFVSTGVMALEKNEKATLWYCQAKYIDKDENLLFNTRLSPLNENGKKFVQQWLKGKRMPIWVSVICRVETLKTIDWFSKDMAIGNAIDMTEILPCAWRGDVLFAKKILCAYTCDENNLSHTTKASQWSSMLFSLYQYLISSMPVNSKYWTYFFIRFLSFNAPFLNIKIFLTIYRHVFTINPCFTFLCSVYYSPYFFARKFLGRGNVFKKIRQYIYKIKRVL